MWRKARLHPREHLLPPGKIVHCRCSVKRRVQVPRETRYTTCRQKIIRKGSAFHRISVQVISHQWVDQPPRCPISERTEPQSKAPLQGGNEPLPPLCQNGSPARRSIAFHDSPKRCVLFQNVPPTPHFTEWGVHFGAPFIWWPKIRPPKITAQFYALVNKRLYIRRECPQFWGGPGGVTGMLGTMLAEPTICGRFTFCRRWQFC